MFIVTLFRGVVVVEVGNGPVGFIFLIGIFPFVSQINFFNLIGYLMDCGIPG